MADRSYRVSRFDVALAPAERTKEGYLRCEGRISRAGNVQEYTLPDGRTQREYRPPEEVFAPASLASLDGVPFTKEHPPALLTAADAKQYAVGMVSQPRQDGDYVAARIVVYDADMIAAIEAGKQQLSVGYDCNVERVTGVSPAGEHYDAIQRGIIGNHVAGVDFARAGDGARIRLDAAGNAVLAHAKPPVYVATQQENAATQQPEKPMPQTIRIDGMTLPADDANAPAIQREIDRLIAESKTRLDAANADKVKADKDRADAVTKFDNVIANAKKWVARIKARLDAMKSRMVTCDECSGTGKIDEAKCDYCDGAGSFRMHDAVKAMPEAPNADPDGDGDVHPDDDMEAMGVEDDVDPSNWAQNAAVHIKTGAEHSNAGSVSKGKGDAKKRADARKILQQKRRDSLGRIADRRAKTRAALLTAAGRHLDGADLDKKSDDEIKRAVVGKLAPHLDAAVVAKMDAAAIGVLYDAETKRAETSGPSPSALLTQSTHPAPRTDAARAAEHQKKIDAANQALYHSHEPKA